MTFFKVVSGQQTMHQSRVPVNYFPDFHNFTMHNADFNCMLYLELEILGGEACMFLLY